MIVIEDIVDYVLRTPQNTNPAVLRCLLKTLLTSVVDPIDTDTISEEISVYASYFASSVYNKKGSNQTLNRENDEDVANNYYVCVADKVPNNAVIKIGDKIVDPDSIFGLSIGNNSFVKDTYYYIEDGKCYVAFPVALFEGVTINSQEIFGADSSNKLVITGSKVVGQGTIQEQEAGQYIANIEKKNSYIDFGLQGVEANDMIISKKIRDGKLSYGFIKADEQVDGVPGIGYYPYLWASTDEAWNNQADITVTEYTLFAPTLNASVAIRVESRKGDAIQPEPEDEVVIYDGGGVDGH